MDYKQSAPRPGERLNAAEGFAGVLVGAVAADGHITQREALELTGLLSRNALFKGLGDRQLMVMFGRLAAIARARGAEGLLDASAPAVPSDLRASAYANAVDLVMCDDELADEEVAYLRKAQAALGVSEELASKMREIFEIKNRG